MTGPQKATKIARQVADLPGVNLKHFAVVLHCIVHIRSRNIPVEGMGFF